MSPPPLVTGCPHGGCPTRAGGTAVCESWWEEGALWDECPPFHSGAGDREANVSRPPVSLQGHTCLHMVPRV